MAAQGETKERDHSNSGSYDDEDDTILEDDIIQVNEANLGNAMVSSPQHKASAHDLQEPNVLMHQTLLHPQSVPVSSFKQVPVFETTLPSESRAASVWLHSEVVENHVTSVQHFVPSVQPQLAFASGVNVTPHESRADSLVSTLTPTLAHHLNKENGDDCDDSAVSSLTDTLAFHRGSSWSLTGTIEDGSASLPRIGQFAFIPKSGRSTSSPGKKEKRKSRRRASKKRLWHNSSQFDQHGDDRQENEPRGAYNFPFTLGAPQMAESVSSMTRHLATEEEWKEEVEYEDEMEQGVVAISPRSSRYSMTGSIIHRDVEPFEVDPGCNGLGDDNDLIVEIASSLDGGQVYSIKSSPERNRMYSATSTDSKRQRDSTAAGLVSIDETGNESCSMVAVANDSVSHYRIKLSDKCSGENNVANPNRKKSVKKDDNATNTAASYEGDDPHNHGVVHYPKWERRLLRYVGVTLLVVFAIFLTLISFWLDQRRAAKRSN